MFLARLEIYRNSVHGHSVMGCCLAPYNRLFGPKRISMDPLELVFISMDPLELVCQGVTVGP